MCPLLRCLGSIRRWTGWHGLRAKVEDLSEDWSRTADFLIVEQDAIVAQDLAEAIRGQRPDAKVQIWLVDTIRDTTVLVDWVSNLLRLDAALLSLPPAEVLASGLGQAVAGRGGQVVILSDEVETGDRGQSGWLVVARPFASDELVRLILGRPGGRAGGDAR